MAQIDAAAGVHVPPVPADSSKEDVDRVIARVASKKDEWVRVGAHNRLELLRRIIESLKVEAHPWAETSAYGHGYDAKNPQHAHLVAEMYTAGPLITAVYLRGLERLYVALSETGRPPPTPEPQKRSDGRWCLTGLLAICTHSLCLPFTVNLSVHISVYPI